MLLGVLIFFLYNVDMEKERKSMQEKEWYKSVKHDPRFEEGKYYAVINDSRHRVMEVYGPFENFDETDKFFEKLGFHYEEEIGWIMRPITMMEGAKLRKEATILGDPNRPLLSGWYEMGEWVQDRLKRGEDPSVPSPSEPLMSPESFRDSKFSEEFHIPGSPK